MNVKYLSRQEPRPPRLSPRSGRSIERKLRTGLPRILRFPQLGFTHLGTVSCLQPHLSRQQPRGQLISSSTTRQLDNSAARQLCGSTTRQLCGSAARQLCGSAALRLCGSAALRLCAMQNSHQSLAQSHPVPEDLNMEESTHCGAFLACER